MPPVGLSVKHVFVIIAALSVCPSASASRASTGLRSLTDIPTPNGFARTELPKKSFGAWLRELKLLPAGTRVKLFDGRLKGNQSAHHAVVDLSIGKRDLQQCADAIIRLRSEYLWDRGRADTIAFRFTNRTLVPWKKWRQGWRTRIKGNKVSWVKRAGASRSRDTFAGYLRTIMAYAGTASLSRDLKSRRIAQLEPGDSLIQGGFPGHGVLVLDEARSASGERVVLLGQSFMPAQNFHVLKNPTDRRLSPWFRVSDLNTGLKTPEWRAFTAKDIRTFGD